MFCNFWQFNVKAAAAHHPIIQKDIDELLAEGVTEPSSGGAGFYSIVFVVPKCTAGLWSILNFKHLNLGNLSLELKNNIIKHKSDCIIQKAEKILLNERIRNINNILTAMNLTGT